MNIHEADIILMERDVDGHHANVIVNTERARTLSPEANVFFVRLAPFVTLMQNDYGVYGFVDTEDIVDAGEEPALLAHPLETTRFLNWFGHKWNAQRPIKVLTVVMDESPQPVRNRRQRTAPVRYTRRGRR